MFDVANTFSSSLTQMKAQYFIVEPKHVPPNENIFDFLRQQIHKQFANKNYYIGKETFIQKTRVPYRSDLRDIFFFAINEDNQKGHLIGFDITDILADTSRFVNYVL